MKIDEKIIHRMEELIETGKKVLSTKRDPPSNYIGFDSRVNSQDAYQWFTSAQSLLSRVFGKDSEHYRNFTEMNGEKGLTYSPVFRAVGILKASKDDYEYDHLFNVQRIIEAEVFDDFLDQSKNLLTAGYHAPAAVICGSVLEDALRKMCNEKSIVLPKKPKLDWMNSELAKTGLYNKLTQKKITAFADIRNNAAHGNWDQFDKEDVEEFIDLSLIHI